MVRSLRTALLLLAVTSLMVSISSLLKPKVAHASANWQAVGSGGISTGTANYTSMAIDSTNTPYVAFADSGVSNMVVVKKWNGSAWTTVGASGISAGAATYVALAIDSSDTPYVAYADGTNSNRVTVQRWTGSTWAAVGSAVSANQAIDLSFVTGPSGTLYVSYRDFANGNKATVMKWNGSAWAAVGSVGLSTGQASFTSITLSSNGTPYVSYQDADSGNKATVQRFNGTSWVLVGTGQVSSGIGNYTQIKLSNNDTPILAYRDGDQTYKASSAAFLGSSSWANFGGVGFSDGQADYLSLDLLDGGTPALAYRDAGNASKATVMSYNGSTWGPIGAKGFSAGAVTYTSLAHDSHDTMYVAYVDAGTSGKAVVEQYVPQYNLTFDEQGGSTVSDISGQVNGAALTLPAAPTRSNYTFLGWNTASDGSGTNYAAGASYTMPGSDTTLYAIWEPGDNDGIATSIENAAPNGGDGNNDGIADSIQPNVASFVNPITGKYVTIVVDAACTLSGLGVRQSSQLGSDQDFTYPLGLLDFTANCGTTGYNSAVKIFYFDPPTSSFSLRKFINSNFQTITAATTATQTIGGHSALTFSYHVIDGGAMDADGLANGIIVDPVGPATPLPAAATADQLANTGVSTVLPTVLATILMGAAIALTFVPKRKSSLPEPPKLESSEQLPA